MGYKRPVDDPNPPRLFAFSLVFISGAVVMMLEMVGFRVLAPFFGYSIYVWGNLIGLIMASLAAGSFLGGRWADGGPGAGLIFRSCSAAGIYVAGMLFFYKDVMSAAAGLGLLGGSLLSTAVVFGPPMALLSTVPPVAVKLLTQPGHVGRAAGRVYALSTAGSLAGVFGAAFGLIPSIGSHWTMACCAALLLIPCFIGVFVLRRGKLLLGAALLLPALAWSDGAPAANVLYRKDSLYFNIQVVQQGTTRVFIRDGKARASTYDPAHLWTKDYWDLANIGALLKEPRRILIVGMGTGTTARQYLSFYPQAEIDGVEIDPDVVDVARRFFGLVDDPRLRLRVADARPFIERSPERYSVVEIDAFLRPLEIPFYLTTREYFAAVAAHMEDGGVAVANVVSPPGTRFVRRLTATLRTSFPSVFVGTFHEHQMIVAVKGRMGREEMAARLKQKAPEELKWVADWAGQNLFEAREEPGDAPLTDDNAPIEQLTYDAVHNKR